MLCTLPDCPTGTGGGETVTCDNTCSDGVFGDDGCPIDQMTQTEFCPGLTGGKWFKSEHKVFIRKTFGRCFSSIFCCELCVGLKLYHIIFQTKVNRANEGDLSSACSNLTCVETIYVVLFAGRGGVIGYHASNNFGASNIKQHRLLLYPRQGLRQHQ